MIFYPGINTPSRAAQTTHCMISANKLRGRRSHFPVNNWILDSGAFTTINKHGGYPEPVEEYAALIRRYADCGNLQIAVAQDWMCEPFVLAKTGLTVHDHQRLTIERYDALIACDTGGIPIMPVLQGYEPAEYARHLAMYGDRLTPGMWVGVGSVCRRNTNPAQIRAVLDIIHQARPDLRLHGFGVKITALHDQHITDHFHTTDSMAWSFAARYEGRDANSAQEANRYTNRVNTQPTQQVLF